MLRTENHNFNAGYYNIYTECHNFFEKKRNIFIVQNFKRKIRTANIKYVLKNDDYVIQ